MITSRNPVLKAGFAYRDVDPAILNRGTPIQHLPMTVEGVLQRVGFMFAPLLVTAVAAYLYAPPVFLLPSALIAFGLAMWGLVQSARVLWSSQSGHTYLPSATTLGCPPFLFS